MYGPASFPFVDVSVTCIYKANARANLILKHKKHKAIII